MSDSKNDRLKARLARGFADRGPAELAATRQMVETIREVYELWGFEALETPFIEYTDALGKFLPDLDRPNEGVFSFQDDDEQWLSLRYDLTAPLARYVAENWDRIPKPFRSYRFGPVFRNEKPGPGRFRQFLQFDADTVGAPSVLADAEMCMMAADTLEALGIPRGSYLIKVNNRKVLDGAMESIGIGGPGNAGKRLAVLRAIDKLDKFPAEEIFKLLGKGRLDESGDFTKGAGLDDESAKRMLAAFAPQIPHGAHFGVVDGRVTIVSNLSDERIQNWSNVLSAWNDTGVISVSGQPSENPSLLNIMFLQDVCGSTQIGMEGIGELLSIMGVVRAAGYGEDRIEIGSPIVRGLEYYTGPVYEAELTFEVKDEDGRPIRFGSVGGGGRYDGLVARFRGEAAPATGFSIGVSRLQAALQALGRTAAEPAGPVVVLVMDKDRTGDYLALARTLREAGIAAEIYLGSSGMKAQMKYADRRRSPVAIIQGSNEKEAGEVTVKDLVLGEQMSAKIADRAEWTDSRPAQVTVPGAKLVETVREMLARHS